MTRKIISPCILWLTFCLNVFAQIFSPALASSDLNVLPDSLKGKELTDLSLIFGTDKCPKNHNFIEVYERYFTPIKNDVKKVFEIGILTGASHKMWKCYFNNAEIYGIDIYSKPWVEKLGIHTFLADQGDRQQLESFINKYGGEYDIIIDDGSHWMEDQQISLGYLFKHLKLGGLYIIEDVHTSIQMFYPEYGKDADLNNTTLRLISDFIVSEKIESQYMLPEEKSYLERHIDIIELSKRNNKFHSTMCIIKKK